MTQHQLELLMQEVVKVLLPMLAACLLFVLVGAVLITVLKYFVWKRAKNKKAVETKSG